MEIEMREREGQNDGERESKREMGEWRLKGLRERQKKKEAEGGMEERVRFAD